MLPGILPRCGCNCGILTEVCGPCMVGDIVWSRRFCCLDWLCIWFLYSYLYLFPLSLYFYAHRLYFIYVSFSYLFRFFSFLKENQNTSVNAIAFALTERFSTLNFMNYIYLFTPQRIERHRNNGLACNFRSTPIPICFALSLHFGFFFYFLNIY